MEFPLAHEKREAGPASVVGLHHAVLKPTSQKSARRSRNLPSAPCAKGHAQDRYLVGIRDLWRGDVDPIRKFTGSTDIGTLLIQAGGAHGQERSRRSSASRPRRNR
jgi:hypothetical protein